MKNFSVATRKMYLRTLKRYLRFHDFKFICQLISQDTAREFVIYRHKQGTSWSTINCDYSSLRKYFREVIYAEWSIKKMYRLRKSSLYQVLFQGKIVVRLINLFYMQAVNCKQEIIEKYTDNKKYILFSNIKNE